MRRDPLARAMRPDKATLAAVALTLGLYRAGRATSDIPVWRMIATTVEELRDRARSLEETLGGRVEIVELRSTVGGGSLPGETLPSIGLALTGGSPTNRLSALRNGKPSVIGRIEDDRVVLDLRTVPPDGDETLARAITAVNRA
jgi:L-seryl-tRNA(Ser) seleniumtransferase